MDKIETIVKMVLERIETIERAKMSTMTDLIPIEVSARHIHISNEHLEYLFGKGYELTPKRQLSQPGEFLSEERVDVIGPKGVLESVAILGPCRQNTQAELSFTDAFSIGVDAPLRLSGDLTNSETIFIKNGSKIIEAVNSTIVAKRHIHMTQEIADRLNVKDQQTVKVKVNSRRPLVFDDVIIRVDEKSTLNMHIDYDEANSCGYEDGINGIIIEVEDNGNKVGIPIKDGSKTNNSMASYKVEKKLITEDGIKGIMQKGYKEIIITKKNIITPLAKDLINKNGISMIID